MPNPVVCGRRFCPSCGRWRHVADFGVAPNGKLRGWCETCQRSSNRKAAASRNAEQRELRREYDRIWREVRRREAGVPERNFKNRRTVLDEKHYERVLLDRDPLVREITWRLRAGVLTVAELEASSGVHERSIQRILSGESKHVRIDIADRLAHALGKSTGMLWAA